jgi:signal transduction histidine kinase
MVERISTQVTLLERYRRLIDNTLSLASTLDQDELLNKIIRAAADLCHAENASIMLYDEARNSLRFEASTNLMEPVARGLVIPVESSIAGWVVKNREPVIVSNVQKDPRYFHEIEKRSDAPTLNLLGVPLILKDRMIGVLEAVNKRGGAFTAEDQILLSALAAQAAVAIQNSRMFQQSDLISELIHELRTPLASLNTAAHLLLRPEVSEDQRLRMVEVIQDETFRLSEMASSYLDLARLESGRAQFKREPFLLTKLLQDCEAFVRGRANEKGLKLSLEIDGTLPQVTADRNKIKQVILNLLSNAIKYNRPHGEIHLRAAVRGDFLEVEVCDTGYGITPEALPHMFEKFYRSPESEKLATGTGLGLSICKYIIEAHRGTISVESQVGSGSTFKFTLPVFKPRQAPTQVKAPVKKTPAKKTAAPAKAAVKRAPRAKKSEGAGDKG